MSYYNVFASLGCLLVAIITLDRLYQRYSHRWTNEPPMLPYRIPIIGHALWFGADAFGLFRYAEATFPKCQPYSLMIFGKRGYVFPDPKDMSTVFRSTKSISFLPLFQKYFGCIRNISDDGMKRLTTINPETGVSVFTNNHAFHRDVLKPGPELDALSLKFLRYLNEALDASDKKVSEGRVVLSSFATWSKDLLGVAATNALLGPTLLQIHPNLLLDTMLVEEGFFLYINKIPRIFGKKNYEARDRVIDAFQHYFQQPLEKRGGCHKVVWGRENELKQAGLSDRDIAACSYSGHAALINGASPMGYNILLHIFSRPSSLSQIRQEIAPAFGSSPTLTTLAQMDHLVKSCPLLRAFHDETLRIHAANSSNRQVIEETFVSGYTLKVGRNVVLPSYVQHNSEEYFSTQTNKFNPERFLVEDRKKRAKPNMLRAFGGGETLCPGRHFALGEVLSFAASVVWRYDITLKGKGVFEIEKRVGGGKV